MVAITCNKGGIPSGITEGISSITIHADGTVSGTVHRHKYVGDSKGEEHVDVVLSRHGSHVVEVFDSRRSLPKGYLGV